MKKFNVCLLTCENAYICRVNESIAECHDTKRGTFCTLVREAKHWRKNPYSLWSRRRTQNRLHREKENCFWRMVKNEKVVYLRMKSFENKELNCN